VSAVSNFTAPGRTLESEISSCPTLLKGHDIRHRLTSTIRTEIVSSSSCITYNLPSMPRYANRRPFEICNIVEFRVFTRDDGPNNKIGFESVVLVIGIDVINVCHQFKGVVT
jgi:hypothetical protein